MAQQKKSVQLRADELQVHLGQARLQWAQEQELAFVHAPHLSAVTPDEAFEPEVNAPVVGEQAQRGRFLICDLRFSI